MDPKRYILTIGLIIISLFSCCAVGSSTVHKIDKECIKDVLNRIEMHTVDPVNDVKHINKILNFFCIHPDFKDFGKYNSNCTYGSPCYGKFQNVFHSYFKQNKNHGVYELFTVDKETHLFYRNESPCRDPKMHYWVIKNEKSVKECYSKEKCEKLGNCVNGCINLEKKDYNSYKNAAYGYKC